MSMDISSVMAKATKFAERATTEDRAGNYDVAAEAYLAAAEWLIHATKYGALNDEMRKNIRARTDSYLKRAETLRNATNKSTAPAAAAGNPVAASVANGQRRAGQDSDADDAMNKFKDAIVKNPNVTFDDVVGLEQAKTALREAVILPIKFPKLFRDERQPWSGILLYGPPGTGKSYLAKATATECNSTFISVTAANILARWVGEGEKNVKALFELARAQRPCVIFIDELDGLCGQRTDTGNDASQRVLNEFLTQMDGVGNDNKGVLVLGATNLPWQLDMAMRRRLQKRIYIPLPESNERQSIFKKHLGTTIPNVIKADEWIQLGQKSESYSGADIGVVCREALLRPIRRLSSATHFKRVPNPNPKPDEAAHLWLACSPGDPDAVVKTLKEISPDELFEPPVTMSDMLAALSVQRPTVNEEALTKYRRFTEEFGQEGI